MCPFRSMHGKTGLPFGCQTITIHSTNQCRAVGYKEVVGAAGLEPATSCV